MRTLLDTTLLASAFTTRGLCADVIVSGDRDLLVLSGTGPVPVLSPRQFWDTLQSGAKPRS